MFLDRGLPITYTRFTLDDTIDTAAITASYVDGVLQVSLPLVPGKEKTERTIAIS